MTKKNFRLSGETAKKQKNYSSSNLDELIKEVKSKEKEGNLVRVNFEIPEELRNAFKAKTAKQGKKVKDVLVAFILDYVKE